MISNLKLASISDIHLGHRKTPTEHVLQNLRTAFPDKEKTEELDIIFFGGDLFDGPLMFYDEAAVKITLWLFDFLTMCAKRNIVVRFLEGTKSHERSQTVWANVAAELGRLPTDMKWVRELSVEHIDELDIDVLYVPDNWRTETDQTWLEVKQLLNERGLTQVDFTIMHGAFKEQLADNITAPSHLVDRYSQITRHRVYAGHIHKSWTHNNVTGNGSFDRFSHGEEEAKGFWKAEYNASGEHLTFVENTNAMIYKTINCIGLSVEDALAKVERTISKTPPGSHLRVWAKAGETIGAALDVLKKKYREYQWSSKLDDRKTAQAKLLVDHRPVSKAVPIDPSNIRHLLMERLIAKQIPSDVVKTCNDNLTHLGYQ